MRNVLSILLSLILVSLATLPLFSQSPISGVWKPVSLEYNGQDTSYQLSELQPGVIIFTKTHYSMAYVRGLSPRPLLGEEVNRSNISDEAIRATFMPYTSNSGVYEVSGNTLPTRPTVALWPDFMNGGFQTFTFKKENEALYLSWPDGLTVKYDRLE